MAGQSGKGKRKRTHKISKGERRSSRPVALSPVQKILIARPEIEHVPCISSWRGASDGGKR